MTLNLDVQIAACDHKPFMHNVLNNHYECLCGKASLPIGATCPVASCLCGRPKSDGALAPPPLSKKRA